MRQKERKRSIFFISFCGQDKQNVLAFTNDLLTKKDIYICHSENNDTYYINEDLISVLNISETFLIFMSENATKSIGMKKEIELILETKKINPDIKILLICIDESKVSDILIEFPRINARKCLKMAVQQVLKAIA